MGTLKRVGTLRNGDTRAAGRAGDQETWCTAAKCLLNISYFDDASDISPDVCTIMLRTLTRLAYRTPRDGVWRLPAGSLNGMSGHRCHRGATHF